MKNLIVILMLIYLGCMPKLAFMTMDDASKTGMLKGYLNYYFSTHEYCEEAEATAAPCSEDSNDICFHAECKKFRT